MAKTYKVTGNKEESFVIESENVNVSRTYQKQWLIDEIARLQIILDQFPQE